MCAGTGDVIMKIIIRVLPLVVIGLLSGPPHVVAGLGLTDARVHAAIGPVWPLGSFQDYADMGGSFSGRLTMELNSVRFVGCWGGIDYHFFSRDESVVRAGEYYYGPYPVVREVTSHAAAVHTGLEAGYRKGVIRPRVIVGIGYYLFFTETSYRGAEDLVDDPDARADTELSDAQGRIGWRAAVGLDVIVSENWGLSFDAFHSAVWRHYRNADTGADIGTSQFGGFMIGVVFTFESFTERIKGDKWEPKDIPRDRR